MSRLFVMNSHEDINIDYLSLLTGQQTSIVTILEEVSRGKTKISGPGRGPLYEQSSGSLCLPTLV